MRWSREQVCARVEEMLSDLGAACTLSFAAKELGYMKPEYLERILYRAGRPDLVRRLIPGRVPLEGISSSTGKYRRSSLYSRRHKIPMLIEWAEILTRGEA